jgi:hypothetical protein
MPDFSLDFVCPICDAQPQEKCEMRSGAPRFESHIERKWIAQDHRRKAALSDDPDPETK